MDGMNNDMDQGGMDDQEMDQMDMTSGHGSVFYVSRYADILFQGASTTSVGGMILAVALVTVVAILYELLRQYTAAFDEPATCPCIEAGSCVVVEMNQDEGPAIRVADDTGLDKKADKGICRRHKAVYILLSVLLHVVSLTISYFLMLIAMTFNVWLFLAVVIGSGLGKLVTMLLLRQAPKRSASHCNMP